MSAGDQMSGIRVRVSVDVRIVSAHLFAHQLE